jgi:Flp pilus assembly protein protease CpaA
MTPIVAMFAAGVAYAGCLWLIAGRIARRRALPLGALPVWIGLICGCAAAGAGSFVAPGTAPSAGAALIGAIVCGLADARTGYIFDALSLTTAAVAAVFAILEGRLIEGISAAALVGGALLALYLLTGRRGIGLGDVKLGSALALGYGLPAAVIALGSAFVLGGLYAGVLLGLGRAKRSDPLRFGPFIAGGAAVGLTTSALGWLR